ncbi:MAG TPA: TolC family protein [Candidatus Acidoferrales bacterium]|nr:TolC family protein [Candidatus Acidoferrales bacterium]
MDTKLRIAGSVMTALAVLMSVPVAAPAQSKNPIPATMPSPVPTPTPNANATPLQYPAYGTPAPDVEQLTQRPGVPVVVNLAQAEKLAVALSPVFAGQNAEWAAINAKYTSEKQAIFPALSANAAVTKDYPQNGITVNRPSPLPNVQANGDNTSEGAQLTLSQLIFDGGRVIAAIRSANEADIAGRGTLLRNLETLQINVASTYYAVLQDNATVTADVQLVREFETNEDSVRAQIRNGAAARSDLAGAQFQTAQARGNLVTAQGVAIGAQAVFATTLGLEADTQILPQQIGEETAGTNPSYQTSLKKALLLRPDYLAAQYTVYSSQDNVRYAKLARFPVLSGNAQYGVSRTLYQDPRIISSNYSNDKSIGLSLQVPIYDQGQTNYNVAVAASQLDQASANLTLTRLTVESDVRSALANLISARANLTQAKAEQRAAQVSLDATQAQYKVGANTILGLVTAEANLSTATASYIAALYGVRTAYQNFLYATGASDLQL